MRLRYLQFPDPCRRDLLRRMAAPFFAFLPLDHPLARRRIEPHPHGLAPAAPAHLIRLPVDRDLAPLRHLPPPLSLPQVVRHPFQLPLFLFLLAPIGPRRAGPTAQRGSATPPAPRSPPRAPSDTGEKGANPSTAPVASSVTDSTLVPVPSPRCICSLASICHT